jgi:hypothetical protein
MRGEHVAMTQDELQAMLSADEEHWWYQGLWSWHDEANLHFRRYDSASLRGAARSAGLEVVGDTHFNGLLLAPAAAVRLAQRRRRRHAHSDLALAPPVLNGVLEWPLRLESRLVAGRTRLPAGLSLLAILRRPAVPAAVTA